MMKMSHRKIVTKTESTIFQNYYEELAGLPVDRTYLEASTLYGFFDSTGEQVAGYALHWGGERCLGFIQDEATKVRFETELPLEQTIEVTCLWMSPRHSSFFDRLQVYIWMFRDVKRLSPRYLLSGSAIPSLKRLHMMLLGRLLYSGPWKDTQKSGWVYFGSTRFLSLKFVRAIGAYAWKRLGSSFKGLQKEGTRHVVKEV